jgi:hypothetical protein
LTPPYIAAVAAYCSLIFYLSHQSELPSTGFSFPGMDKVAHGVMFGGLAATVAVGLRRSNDVILPWRLSLIPFFFAAFYGLMDEIHQLFVIDRTFDVLDIVADVAGALLVQVFLCRFCWRIFAQEKANPVMIHD